VWSVVTTEGATSKDSIKNWELYDVRSNCHNQSKTKFTRGISAQRAFVRVPVYVRDVLFSSGFCRAKTKS
jgi:hypothetical protein